MPIKRSSTRAALRLADLTFHEKFALMSSWWRPDSTVRSAQDLRFRTWAQFFEIYELVRDELLAERRHHWPAWADVARPLFQADADHFDPDVAAETYEAGKATYARRSGVSFGGKNDRAK